MRGAEKRRALLEVSARAGESDKAANQGNIQSSLNDKSSQEGEQGSRRKRIRLNPPPPTPQDPIPASQPTSTAGSGTQQSGPDQFSSGEFPAGQSQSQDFVPSPPVPVPNEETPNDLDISDVEDNSQHVVEPPRAPMLPLRNHDRRNPQEIQSVPYFPHLVRARFEAEKRSLVQLNFLANQPEVDEDLRAQVVNNIEFVTYRKCLKPSTMHLAVYLVDCVLSAFPVRRPILRTLAIGAMFVACKLEEQDPVYIDQFFKCLEDDGISVEAVTAMEATILNLVQFNVDFPSANTFAMMFLFWSDLHADQLLVHGINFLLEVALVCYSCVSYSRSHLAAGAVFAAARLLAYVSPLVFFDHET
eukprot:c10854_g1_i2.p1 GENE.c10854_g1_i2~~c10854_g1_i2.p1  ORF type:complete len:359 (+),score=51.03 c10854_g1_i2:21-1097(+)